MPLIRPYNGASQERLLSLINAKNTPNLALGTDFTFGTITNYTDDEGRNTRVTLIANPSSNYVDDEIFYTRLPLDIIGNLPIEERPKVIINALPFTIHEILPQINATLGLSLSTDEVLNSSYTDEEPSYEITVVEGSLAWLPSTYSFQAHHEQADVDLSDVITTTELDGLVF